MPYNRTIRIISWNIDGIKARFEAVKRLVAKYEPDILCLQKFKCSTSPEPYVLPGYGLYVSGATYAGVATYFKDDVQVVEALAEVRGHVHILTTPEFTLFNAYAPYASRSIEGAVANRNEFDHRLLDLVRVLKENIIVCGDMNIVHGPQDVWDGKYVSTKPCFTEWERESFDNLLRNGKLIDTYRHLHPDERGYTYFGQAHFNDYRAINQGSRIDYFLASESFVPQITDASIIKDITDSPSNPILLEFKY